MNGWYQFVFTCLHYIGIHILISNCIICIIIHILLIKNEIQKFLNLENPNKIIVWKSQNSIKSTKIIWELFRQFWNSQEFVRNFRKARKCWGNLKVIKEISRKSRNYFGNLGIRKFGVHLFHSRITTNYIDILYIMRNRLDSTSHACRSII